MTKANNNLARASKHHRWKSKHRIITSHGYVMIRVGVNHRLANPKGYAYEHLVVWVSNGNPIPPPGKLLHHRNNDKTDNREENLVLITRPEHSSHHAKRRKRRRNGTFA